MAMRLLMQLDLAGIAASLGSACASGSTRLSPTLVAMRVPDDRLRSSVRFSLGARTTENDIEEAIRRIVKVVERIGAIPARGKHARAARALSRCRLDHTISQENHQSSANVAQADPSKEVCLELELMDRHRAVADCQP